MEYYSLSQRSWESKNKPTVANKTVDKAEEAAKASMKKIGNKAKEIAEKGVDDAAAKTQSLKDRMKKAE